MKRDYGRWRKRERRKSTSGVVENGGGVSGKKEGGMAFVGRV